MNIILTTSAINWFKEELNIQEGEFVRFFVRYGGCSTVQQGFSLGITKANKPLSIGTSIVVDDVTFYVEEEELWYFNDHDLHVDYNKEKGEIIFR